MDASVSVMVDVQNTLVNNVFSFYASDEVKSWAFPKLAQDTVRDTRTHTLTRAWALVRPGPAPAFVPVAHTGHRWSLPTPQLGCFCLSEPNAGSDAFALTTRAEDKGDHWLINGNKMWITNSGEAGLFLVRAVVTGLRLIAVHACRRV